MSTLPQPQPLASPHGSEAFSLDDDRAYRRWRDWKLDHRPRDAAAVTVELGDAHSISTAERRALLDRLQHFNLALYRTRGAGEDKALPVVLAAQLGMRRLDANWLADEDGVSSIEVSQRSDGKGGFIPYTTQPIRWHTDGYYHPESRRIRGMVLHCVRPAASGGANRLLDHELAYIALRDESPQLVRALMRADAMTIPERSDADGVAREAQSGPVFSVAGGALHMRYTARTRSIEWSADPELREAAAWLAAWLESSPAGLLAVRMAPGMGLVCHNVLHDRSAFVDDPDRPRLVYRARFLGRAGDVD